MLEKQFVITIVCLLAVHQMTVLASTLDDAKQALQELEDLYSLLIKNIALLFFEISDDFGQQLDVEITAATQEVNNQVAAISEKIYNLTQNAKVAGINGSDFCQNTTQNDLYYFAFAMKQSIQACYSSNIRSFNGLMTSSYNKIWYEYSTMYNCNNMSLSQCSQHEDPKCFDFVIGNIELAKEKITKLLAMNQADLLNQTPQVNINCRQLSAQEMNFYSELLMNFVSTCIQSITSDALLSYSGCNF